MITQSQLDGYLGKSIGAIVRTDTRTITTTTPPTSCPMPSATTSGVTCQMMGNGRGTAATLRVHDLFPKCKSVGVWSLRPSSLSTCLVFMTRASNVNLAGKVMSNIPRKQVGIYLNGFIWHYSNSRHQVIKETPSQFKRHYPSPDNAVFYGSLP